MKEKTPIDTIREAEFSLIPAFWKRSPVLVKVRRLSQVQIYSCGSFSLIDLEKTKTPFSWKRWAEYAKQKYAIVKASLVSPTYDEIMGLVGASAMTRDAEKEFEEIGKLIEKLPRGPDRQRIENYRDSLLCKFRFLLPDDFLASILQFAMSEDISDIKAITHEMLLSAALLAENGHDNPADHLDGAFTAFNRDDINIRAWSILKDERAKRKPAKAGKHAD